MINLVLTVHVFYLCMLNVEVDDSELCKITGLSGAGGGCSQGVKVATFYQRKYRCYFVVVDESQKKMLARCMLCLPSKHYDVLGAPHPILKSI